MKVLINTISREDIINKAEVAAGLQPNAEGEKKPGTEEEIAFAATLSCPEIDGYVFPGEQWIHLDEKWIEKNQDILAKYPDLKEPHVILKEDMAKIAGERGWGNFAKGIEDAAVLYKQDLPEIARVMLEIAPVKVEVG